MVAYGRNLRASQGRAGAGLASFLIMSLNGEHDRTPPMAPIGLTSNTRMRHAAS